MRLLRQCFNVEMSRAIIVQVVAVDESRNANLRMRLAPHLLIEATLEKIQGVGNACRETNEDCTQWFLREDEKEKHHD
jgi:hypothetical protein